MKAIFGKKEASGGSGGGGNHSALPKPPTTREIFEDIENIKKNDPILSLASVLDTTGRHSLVDTDLFEYIDAWKRRKRRESASSTTATPISGLLPQNTKSLTIPSNLGGGIMFKRKFSRSRRDSSGNNSDVQPPSPSYSASNSNFYNDADAGKGSKDNKEEGGGGANSSNDLSTTSSTPEDEFIGQAQLDYDKIKHFLTTLEHSEEVTDAIDAEFVRLFKDMDKLSIT